jgi:hypothetical protein
MNRAVGRVASVCLVARVGLFITTSALLTVAGIDVAYHSISGLVWL